MQVDLRILRYDPERDETPHWEAYAVECDPKMDRVLDLLHRVKYEQDGSLTFRRSCAHGVCGSDAMLINGRNRLACKLRVEQLGKRRITVAPLPGLPVIKDLVVDMDGFFDKFKSVQPYLMQDDEVPADGRGLTGPATTTRPSASCAPPARRRARRSGPSPRTWGRPPSSTPTGSSSTRATTAATSAWSSWPMRTACGAAGPSSTAPTPARGVSTSPRRSSRSARRSRVAGPERHAVRRGQLVRSLEPGR
jgi:hypothetical protein